MPRLLRAGDRVRLVRLPPIWATPGYIVPADTRRVYLRLIERGRPLRVCEVDPRGEAWVWCRLRGRGGRVEHHSITLDDGCWVRVVSRGGRRRKPESRARPNR